MAGCTAANSRCPPPEIGASGSKWLLIRAQWLSVGLPSRTLRLAVPRNLPAVQLAGPSTLGSAREMLERQKKCVRGECRQAKTEGFLLLPPYVESVSFPEASPLVWSRSHWAVLEPEGRSGWRTAAFWSRTCR